MRRIYVLALTLLVACSAKQSAETTASLESANGLKASSEFSSIEDDEARAKAVFNEMAKVIEHPRCLNCHPAGDSPLQGDAMKPHQPLVVRGEGGFGAPGMRCGTCHGEANFRSMPGNPHWHLAPASMAWVGKSTGEICEQLKDRDRNGDMSLDEIVEHMAKDSLVGWGWNPPDHLEAAPGNQALLGDLTRAWVEAGAHCPE